MKLIQQVPKNFKKWPVTYAPKKKYAKKVAYFSMEFAIHQGFEIYSGGLGFLAGSHMRSAYGEKQNLIGIGMLWKYGYYDQRRNGDGTMEPRAIERNYNFLLDTGIEVTIELHGNSSVKVKAYYLPPEVFGTVPMYFLTTDVEGNDYLSRTITHHLYDSNEVTRVSQSIVLGIGGAKVVEALGGADIYHLNEGHGLPAFYYLRDKGVTRDQMAFTTHTPEKGGNEERNAYHLNECGFFGRTLRQEELEEEMVNGSNINYTVAALRFAKKANGVSKLHGMIANEMWKDFPGICEIIPITNAQNRKFWQDPVLKEAHEKKNPKVFDTHKKQLKQELFKEVLRQTGKIFDPNVLTMVWARRFAGYKRADLLLYDLERFEKMVRNSKHPIQIIWAGKPYPKDNGGIDIFNRVSSYTRQFPNLAVLTGYELQLSRMLKRGSDIWLNNPRITREASGTSGMTAAMNGSVNVGTNDGWIPEFIKNKTNGFVIPALDYKMPVYEQDRLDHDNLMTLLEKEIIPLYYKNPAKWMKIVFNAMEDVVPQFGSDRMAKEYYELLYNASVTKKASRKALKKQLVEG